VLERVEREVGKPCDVASGRVHAEHPALIARTIAVINRPLKLIGQRNRTPV
jgi:hypothetical protein